jgi:MFS family permease
MRKNSMKKAPNLSAGGIRERLGLERNVLVLGTASMIATFGSTTWFFFLPIYYTTKFDVSALTISIIYAAWLAATALGPSSAGKLADIYGRKVIVVASGLISGGATFLLAFSSGNFLLSATAFPLAGFGTSFLGISRVMVAESVVANRRGVAFGTYQTFTYLMSALSPIVGGITIVTTSSYFDLFIFGGILVIIGTLIRALFLKETLSRDDSAKEREKRPSFLAILSAMAKNRILLALMIAYSLYNLLLDQNSFVVPLYINQVLALNYINTGFAFAILQALVAISRLPFGELSDRIGRRETIVVSWLGESTLVYIFVFAPIGDVNQALIGIAVWTIFGVMDGPALDAWLADSTQAKTRGFSMGTFYSIVNAFAIPPFIVTGYLYTISPQLPFYANSVLGLFALCILIFLSRSRGKGAIKEATDSVEH